VSAPVTFLRPRDLAARWGNLATSTLWRMRQRGDLPEPTRLSPGIVGWRLDVIEAIEAERTPETKSAPSDEGRGR
jgi:predicted DNA-binding transcriptional regulator AlpA